VDWTRVAQDREQWWALVVTAMNLRAQNRRGIS